MVQNKFKVMILTAEDSMKVFRMDQERLDAALKRHPDIADIAEFSFTRTTTSYENTPSWNEADHQLFYHDVADKDIILGYMFPLDRFAEHAPDVRYIHIIGAGVEHLTPLDWLPKGSQLTNNRGAHAPKSAEYAMMCMLMLGNHMPRLYTAQRESRWDGHFLTIIEGNTAVVVGAGKQGSAIAKAAKKLGIRVIGVDPNVREKEGFEKIVPPSEMCSVLGEADYVFLTLPASPENLHMFGARQFAAMKPEAGFVNLCRGSVLETEALIHALKSNQISGAILDVFEQEPLPQDSPLWTTPNLVMTPHMGCDDEDNYIHRTFDIFFDNLRRLYKGEALENVVDPVKGY
ncbi:D-2-hydroxyacid dehydrogenase [Clostridium sp. chh4-2]|uniref:D-2-hydroxyacid dehydrogenase n=1 Tax=Clostridium sp. chh4-2 TaxID=2067550 RepID=UPI000CCE259E|nr:D-2-hydroxyacid dehydrogenase [Clostridium sp. chh4-2]PNV60888.1 D-2-hydroxyacid dehydrogenase [Clostridium sp. chh4-2]